MGPFPENRCDWVFHMRQWEAELTKGSCDSSQSAGAGPRKPAIGFVGPRARRKFTNGVAALEHKVGYRSRLTFVAQISAIVLATLGRFWPFAPCDSARLNSRVVARSSSGASRAGCRSRLPNYQPSLRTSSRSHVPT